MDLRSLSSFQKIHADTTPPGNSNELDYALEGESPVLGASFGTGGKAAVSMDFTVLTPSERFAEQTGMTMDELRAQSLRAGSGADVVAGHPALNTREYQSGSLLSFAHTRFLL